MEKSLYDVLLEAFKLQGYKIEDVDYIAIINDLRLHLECYFDKKVKQISDKNTQQIGYYKKYDVKTFFRVCKFLNYNKVLDRDEWWIRDNLTIYMKDGNFFRSAGFNYLVFFNTKEDQNIADKQQTIVDCFVVGSILQKEYEKQQQTSEYKLNKGIIELIKEYVSYIFYKHISGYLCEITPEFIENNKPYFCLFPCFKKFYIKYNNFLYSFEENTSYEELSIKSNNDLKTKNMICIDLDEK